MQKDKLKTLLNTLVTLLRDPSFVNKAKVIIIIFLFVVSLVNGDTDALLQAVVAMCGM